jgi:GTP-binding protein
MDKPDQRANEVIDEVYDLFLDLNAADDQLDFPILYGVARQGIVRYNWESDTNEDITPLFETIIHHAQAYPDLMDEAVQMQVCALAYDDYIGRLGIGRIYSGTLREATVYSVSNRAGKDSKGKTNQIFVYKGLSRVPVAEAQCGEIVMISGIPDISIGDTLCPEGSPDPMPVIKIEEPTLSMNFMVNDSPFAGQVGKFVTSRNIRERLEKELEVNVGLRVEETDSTDTFKVSGRGELHLSVLIETMRREGYEFAVSKAEVINKTVNGKTEEPVELAYVDVPDEFSGAVISNLSERKGELLSMNSIAGGYTRLEFRIPSRGLIGFRGPFMTETKGNGIINTVFDGYAPYKGDIAYRKTGSLIAFEAGEAVPYGLFNAQDRGSLFIGPGTIVYSGMVIGSNPKSEDIEVNVCKTKHLTNTRTSSSDEALRLVPPINMSLEQCLDFIDNDELLEVTPVSLRIRKRILDPVPRKRAGFAKKNQN